MLAGLIESAMANAGQDGTIDVKDLYVKYVVANDGPLKQSRLRFRPGPQGRAMPFRKRMTHFELLLGVKETKKSGRRTRRKKEDTKPEAAKGEGGKKEAGA